MYTSLFPYLLSILVHKGAFLLAPRVVAQEEQRAAGHAVVHQGVVCGRLLTQRPPTLPGAVEQLVVVQRADVVVAVGRRIDDFADADLTLLQFDK